jgi:hypothetical protein
VLSRAAGEVRSKRSLGDEVGPRDPLSRPQRVVPGIMDNGWLCQMWELCTNSMSKAKPKICARAGS